MNGLTSRAIAISILCCFIVFPGLDTHSAWSSQDRLPVIVPDEEPCRNVNLRFPKDFLHKVKITQHPTQPHHGLSIDLGDRSLYGVIYTGPYPFEEKQSDFDHPVYRVRSHLKFGKGLLPISRYFRKVYNVNDWPADESGFTGTIAYRLELWQAGKCHKHLGFYDGVVSFRRVMRKQDSKFIFEKNVSIVSGPFISLLTSDKSQPVIAWRTDEKCACRLSVYRPGAKDKPQSKQFSLFKRIPSSRSGQRLPVQSEWEVSIPGLEPDTTYQYDIECKKADQRIRTNRYTFKTAPPAGKGTVVLAFSGDSREGVGGGERAQLGVNRHTLNWIARQAYRKGADFILFGGDLIDGYTSDENDFILQLRNWKQGLAGFWHTRPVYPCMGNHEALLNYFQQDGQCGKYGLGLDKWDEKKGYKKHSAEAVFARELYNPKNGPVAAEHFPPYTENVYKFHYGPLLVIAFNDNYWFTFPRFDRKKWKFYIDRLKKYGGSPEGYILEDQLTWIEKTLKEAQENETVKYVVLYAQEPVFPCGGHTSDAMWYWGDNRFRAFVRKKGSDQTVEAGPGIIEVRNRLWEAISNCKKVAAVFTSDEHAFHSVLITSETPVGIPEKDANSEGVLEKCFSDPDTCSPNPKFKYPTWHFMIGAAGAPFYSNRTTPWKPDFYSSESGYGLVKFDEKAVSFQFITTTGQILYEIPDLMKGKR